MNRWRDYILILALAIGLALIVRSYLVTAYKVPTGSMQPTLKPGDFIFASRISYGVQIPFRSEVLNYSLPEHGDLVIFSYSQQPDVTYVKRVVGLPGDRVQLVKGRLVINEIPAEYEKVQDQQQDNPNAELFDIFQERTQGHSRRVIFQKRGVEDFGPFVVPPEEIFLLGDNRDASDDSRYWGTVPMSQVKGQVVLIWLSLDWQRKWGGQRYPSVRWDRVFLPIH